MGAAVLPLEVRPLLSTKNVDHGKEIEGRQLQSARTLFLAGIGLEVLLRKRKPLSGAGKGLPTPDLTLPA